MYLIYNSSGQMQMGRTSTDKGPTGYISAYQRAASLSNSYPDDTFSVYKDFVLDRQYKAGRIYSVPKAVGATA